MPIVIFKTADGAEHRIESELGESLMRLAVENNIDAINAECGGACSCATCHCYIDEKWIDRLPPVEDLEESMLECVFERKENSRLSCQISLTEEIDGIIIHVPASQY